MKKVNKITKDFINKFYHQSCVARKNLETSYIKIIKKKKKSNITNVLIISRINILKYIKCEVSTLKRKL